MPFAERLNYVKSEEKNYENGTVYFDFDGEYFDIYEYSRGILRHI